MKLINLHTHQCSNNPDILEVVNQYPESFDVSIPRYSIGIHPWYIDQNNIKENLRIIESKVHQNSCLAIGECGLDKRIDLPLQLQYEVFEAQLKVAQKFQKPVIIHCVAAFQELIELKNKLSISVPMIVHGFSKNEQLAEQLLNNGFYLSFGKYLLRNPELQSVFQSIPDHRFFLETDTVQESIADVYALAAKYRNVDVQQLQQIVSSNFNKVFKYN